MLKILALLRRRKRPPDALARIPPWSDLGRAAVAIHIADASNTKKGRKGWAALSGGAG